MGDDSCGMGFAIDRSMRSELRRPRSKAAAIAFDLLDPIPYGLFVGALLFDAIYAKSAEALWLKAASWLIAIGLLFAVVPRFVVGPRQSSI